MNRRDFLRAGGAVGGALALAGCTETALESAKTPPPALDDWFHQEELELPVDQLFEVVAEAVERADGTTLGDPDELEAYLTDEGVEVEDLKEEIEEGEPILSLSHLFRTTGKSIAEIAGVVAGGYAALVRSDPEFEELKVEVHEPDGRLFGGYEVATTWAEEYDAGELSAAEYGGQVLHTLASEHE